MQTRFLTGLVSKTSSYHLSSILARPPAPEQPARQQQWLTTQSYVARHW